MFAAVVALGALAPARPAKAQGCVVVRPTAPVTIALKGAALGPYLDSGGWQVSVGYRWFRSDRDYSGDSEDPVRAQLQAQDINDVHNLVADVAYALSRRFSVALTLPYQIAERSEPIYTPDGGRVLARNRSAARGIGDASVSARGWILSPDGDPPANLLVGVGLKMPTGQDNATDSFRSATAPTAVRTVDASIQPGDGGIGVLLGLQGFATLGRVSPYLSATYLLNPRETSGVVTYLPQPNQSFLSVPDAYLVRAGSFVGIAGGLAGGLGVRFEGTPVKDVLGGSGGFRRPGYVFSLEPGVSLSTGAWSISVSVPIALLRNRLRSVAEREDGTRGHAAFADYAILLGASYRFGGPSAPAAGDPHTAMPAPTVRIGRLPITVRPIDLQPPTAPLGKKLTVLNVWATWCAPCRSEIPILDSLRVAYAERGVAFIGLSVDEDAGAIAKFLREVPFQYPTYWAGPDIAETATALGVENMPATLVLDETGALVGRYAGPPTREGFSAWLDRLLGRTERDDGSAAPPDAPPTRAPHEEGPK